MKANSSGKGAVGGSKRPRKEGDSDAGSAAAAAPAPAPAPAPIAGSPSSVPKFLSSTDYLKHPDFIPALHHVPLENGHYSPTSGICSRLIVLRGSVPKAKFYGQHMCPSPADSSLGICLYPAGPGKVDNRGPVSHGVCGHTFAVGSSISNFLKHAINEHPACIAADDYEVLNLDPVTLKKQVPPGSSPAATSSSSSASKSSSSGSLAKMLTTKVISVAPFVGDYALFGRTPFSVAEDVAFRHYTEDVATAVAAAGGFRIQVQHTSRFTAQRLAMGKAQEEKLKLSTMLQEHARTGGTMATTIDYGSTEGAMHPMMALTGHLIRRPVGAAAWQMLSVVLGLLPSPGRHTSAATATYADSILEGLGLTPAVVSALTKDGASNMNLIFALIMTCDELPCNAHVLSNIGKELIDEFTGAGAGSTFRSLYDMFDNLHKIIVCIRSSSLRREHFLTVQVSGLHYRGGHYAQAPVSMSLSPFNLFFSPCSLARAEGRKVRKQRWREGKDASAWGGSQVHVLRDRDWLHGGARRLRAGVRPQGPVFQQDYGAEGLEEDDG